MPRFACVCGESISLSGFPNESEFYIFDGRQLEDLQTDVASRVGAASTDGQRRSLINTVLTERRPQPEVIECPSCGRLALFRSPGDDRPINWYIPEPQPGQPRVSLKGLFAAERTRRG